MLIVDPYGLTARDWTDYMGSELEGVGQLPILRADEEWRDWATAALMLPQVAAVNPPDPYIYDDWRDWATRFIQLINTLNQ